MGIESMEKLLLLCIILLCNLSKVSFTFVNKYYFKTLFFCFYIHSYMDVYSLPT